MRYEHKKNGILDIVVGDSTMKILQGINEGIEFNEQMRRTFVFEAIFPVHASVKYDDKTRNKLCEILEIIEQDFKGSMRFVEYIK